MLDATLDWAGTIEVVHLTLAFNGMVMTISNDSDKCHKDARFWLPFSNIPRVDAYCRLAQIAKVVSKDHFGKLVAAGIIVVRPT